MNSDEMAQVLKKTHNVIPVIASDQIATLLPLVNHIIIQLVFVINSQSVKKTPGYIGRLYTLIGKMRKFATLIV